jgi:tetratricopeptide (TPR) repeat protein
MVPVPPVAPLFAAAVALPPAVIDSAPVTPPAPPAQTSQLAAAATGPAPAPVAGPAHSGLLVCEPAPAGTDPALAAFGSGCGRWLHLMAAGQPALACTPLWNSLARAQTELGRTDLRLTPPQTTRLTHILGLTHVATGRITGTAAHCTLTYTLWRLPRLTPVGAPVTLTGSEAQVLAQLPGLARTLDARLGVARPAVPAAVALTPAELGFLGGLARYPDLTDAQLATLAGLAARSPLAGMTLLNTPATADQGVLDRTVAALVRRQPNNALVLAQIADTAPAALRPDAALVTAQARRYPGCYLMTYLDGTTQGVWGTRAGEWRAARRGVADAPENPAAWVVEADVIADIGNDVRQARTSDLISDKEYAFLGPTYARWEAAASRATALDPADGRAWLCLSSAATFAGDDARATAAIWRALKLIPDDEGTLWWGLEMFQPKWLADKAALDRVAALAAAAHYGSAAAAGAIATELRTAGYPALADGLLAAYLAQARADVARRPGSGAARWQLAAALEDVGDGASVREAAQEYQAALALLPNCPNLHDDYGSLLDKQGRLRDAVAQYRQTVALDPFSAKGYWDLGWDLKQQRQLPAAKAALSRSIHLDPTDGSVYKALGYVLCDLKEWPAAASAFAAASRLDPDDLEVLSNYANALDGAHRYPQAIAVSREALVLDPTDGYADDVIADADLHTHAWRASIEASEAALQIDPNDSTARAALAKAYAGEGVPLPGPGT